MSSVAHDVAGVIWPGDPPESTWSHSIFVNPHERRDGFWANIRGHVLDLGDPNAEPAAVPTPDDLYITSMASELAWTVRTLLRSSGLPDDVSVSAQWRMHGVPQRIAEVILTVDVPGTAEPIATELTASLPSRLAARSSAQPPVRISFKGTDR